MPEQINSGRGEGKKDVLNSYVPRLAWHTGNVNAKQEIPFQYPISQFRMEYHHCIGPKIKLFYWQIVFTVETTLQAPVSLQDS